MVVRELSVHYRSLLARLLIGTHVPRQEKRRVGRRRVVEARSVER